MQDFDLGNVASESRLSSRVGFCSRYVPTGEMDQEQIQDGSARLTIGKSRLRRRQKMRPLTRAPHSAQMIVAEIAAPTASPAHQARLAGVTELARERPTPFVDHSVILSLQDSDS